MPVYYRGHCARVTHDLFEVRCPSRHSFKVADLSNAYVVASSAAIGAPWHPRPRLYELWACYRGTPVRLFSNRDARVFGQVRRALMRALEWHLDAG